MTTNQTGAAEILKRILEEKENFRYKSTGNNEFHETNS